MTPRGDDASWADATDLHDSGAYRPGTPRLYRAALPVLPLAPVAAAAEPVAGLARRGGTIAVLARRP